MTNRLPTVQEVAQEIDTRFCGDFPNARMIEPILREWAEAILKRAAFGSVGIALAIADLRHDLGLER